MKSTLYEDILLLKHMTDQLRTTYSSYNDSYEQSMHQSNANIQICLPFQINSNQCITRRSENVNKNLIYLPWWLIKISRIQILIFHLNHKSTCTTSENLSFILSMRTGRRFSAAILFKSSGRDRWGYFGSCSRSLWVHLCSGCERDPLKSAVACVGARMSVEHENEVRAPCARERGWIHIDRTQPNRNYAAVSMEP